ncbi:BMA-NPP-19, isoform g [Dirofilaria immitis]|nr:BMA-NPP-19, isoform g [Dirofilaria immitis]
MCSNVELYVVNFSDSNRLSGSNTGSLATQHATPNFLFGSRSRRRSLIASFTSDTPEKRSSDQSDILRSSMISKNSSQTSKSVHWSPSLTQTKHIYSNNARENFYMDTDLDKSSSKGPDVSVDPPLRSMRENCYRQSLYPKIQLPYLQTYQAHWTFKHKEIAAHWITVFGFSREDATNVLKLFARHGTVVAHRFPKEGNWMHLRYASPIHAQQALSRNGQIVDGRLRLGVLPELVNLEDDTYLNSFSHTNNENIAHNRSILSENSLLCGVTPLISPNTVSRPLETSFNSSLISSSARPGIRSLRASFNSIDSYYRVDEETEPVKSQGLLDKLWSFVS